MELARLMMSVLLMLAAQLLTMSKLKFPTAPLPLHVLPDLEIAIRILSAHLAFYAVLEATSNRFQESLVSALMMT